MSADVIECDVDIERADAGGILGDAMPLKREVGAVAALAGDLVARVAAREDVFPQQLSGLIDRAEACGLVHREGMKRSGLTYVFTERAAQRGIAPVPPVAVMATVLHVFGEASRAVNILENPDSGYIARKRHRLYGDALKDIWSPLLP